MTRPDLAAARSLLHALDALPGATQITDVGPALADDLRALLAAWDAAARDEHPRRGDVYVDDATTWRHVVVAVDGGAVTLRQASGAEWQATRERVARLLRLEAAP